MKKVIYAGVAVAGGIFGAYLFMRWKKKNGGCGCGGTVDTPLVTTPGTSQPIVATPATGKPAESGEITFVQTGVGQMAADGAWLKGPKMWTV